LRRRGIPFEALDNGVRTCANPKALQRLCEHLDAAKIDGLLRKWLRRLPHPLPAAARRAGCRYDISILQAEFCLTQVLDRPLAGRVFFDDVICENLDIGRPGQVQLIFDRRVTRRTPGRFRTRVITAGVTPSLHVDYKHSRIKQYHKDGQALRTGTTSPRAARAVRCVRGAQAPTGLSGLPPLPQATKRGLNEMIRTRQRRAHAGRPMLWSTMRVRRSS
jgi:hypothetical protein